MVAGSNPAGPITQASENKEVTENGTPNSKSQKQKLAPSLFLESEIDPELKQVVEAWPELSVELRSAIVKIVR